MAIDKAVDSTQLDGYFSAIATAIRQKAGTQATLTPAQMPAAIQAIPTGGGGDDDRVPLLLGVFDEDASLDLSDVTGLTHIRQRQFDSLTQLTTVILPDSVTMIDDYAFNGCSKLQMTALPSQLQSIDYYAFANCTLLALDDLPDTLTNIGNNAFLRTKVAFLALPTGLTSIGANAFQYCEDLKVSEIPATVTSLGNYSFQFSGIEEIDIKPHIKITASNPIFGNCQSLTTAKIRLQQLGTTSTGGSGYAFQSCPLLKNVWISDDCTIMGRTVFNNCAALTDIYCEATSKPSGWSNYWADNTTAGTTRTIHWGTSEADFDAIVSAQ